VAGKRQVVVETARVTKVFRDFWLRKKVKALERVDLQVNHGEIFGLLGPNGSGKSTLVKILLGLLFPTSGRAAVFGRDPRNLAVKDRIGYMPEESYLYRYLNAEETLEFYGRLFNLPGGERRHRIKLLLEMVGLEKQKKRQIGEYSKGMARRIGLAQALINDPDLVFLDEPTTGLDPIGTREIKDVVLELKRRGKTVFMCSHLLADVEDVCDRVAILYGGKLRRVSDVNSLLRVQAQTQITTGELKPETVAKVVETIKGIEGAGMEVEVGRPRERLETVFLRVVEEAQSARVETAGTMAGTGADVYFSAIDRGEKASAILEDLLKTTEERKAPVSESEVAAEPTVVVPASEPEEERSEAVLDELLARSPAEGGEEEAEPEAPHVARAAEVEDAGPSTRDVLDGLLHPGGEKRDEAEGDKASHGEKER